MYNEVFRRNTTPNHKNFILSTTITTSRYLHGSQAACPCIWIIWTQKPPPRRMTDSDSRGLHTGSLDVVVHLASAYSKQSFSYSFILHLLYWWEVFRHILCSSTIRHNQTTHPHRTTDIGPREPCSNLASHLLGPLDSCQNFKAICPG